MYTCITGGSDGITGGGVNGGMSHSRQKQTVLTTLNGNAVNIATQERTTLRGAMIAAVDQNGQDNGNLNIKTNTLEVSSLNNRRDSKSMSLGLNAGISNQQQRDTLNNSSTLNSVSIDFANDRTNSKTKTLGTIGKGNIELASVDKSNTKMLNRDINNNEINIYDIESKRGLKGTVDTRMFTKSGRAEIAEEVKKAKVGFYDVAKDIMSKKELTILDTFSYQGNKIAFYDGMQKALRENTNGIRDTFANPNATRAEKNAAVQQVADSINAQLGVKHGNKVAVISTDAKSKDGKEIVGAYHKPSGDIVLNDKNINSTGEAVKGLGHELGHAVGYGEGVAKVMGESLQDYANFGIWNYGSGGQSLASTNNHTGTVDSQGNTIATTGIATQNFVERRNNDKLDYSIYVYKDIVVGTDGINNHKVIKLNAMETLANGFMDNYYRSTMFKQKFIDKVNKENLSKYKKVFSIDKKKGFEELRKGTDMNYDDINKDTKIVFENGMMNDDQDAIDSQTMIQKDFPNAKVGLINNVTGKNTGVLDDVAEWIPNYLTTKDVLNAQKLQELSPSTVVVTHSAGNEDIHKANEVNALVGATTPYRHISVASPKSTTELKKADNSVGATFIKQTNHPNDPVANGWVNGDANYEFKSVMDIKENHPFNMYYPEVKSELNKVLNNE